MARTRASTSICRLPERSDLRAQPAEQRLAPGLALRAVGDAVAALALARDGAVGVKRRLRVKA